jgi:acetyl-CoA/propionyl-CoA carboxylase biotin carboxyl carrier protein
VVSTRDCSLQRRHQKLVEEAPAPFLSDAQVKQLYDASKAILRAAGYVGAGTCEFLVAADGSISFLEVNTRLQVEHPVSEEVSGLDLVREMFRVADGEPLGYGDPELRGHSIEFRINAEDPARNFLPAPGTITEWSPPSGPGVRLDAGYGAGQTVPQEFDSLIGKLIVTGASRAQALERARRALAEFTIGGMPTVLPFHRAVADDPAFAGDRLTVHTRWIETEMVPVFPGPAFEPQRSAPVFRTTGAETPGRETVTVEVGGKRLEVTVPSALSRPAGSGGRQASSERGRAPRGPARRSASRAASGSGDSLVSPMQGTIVKIVAAEGTQVGAGDTVVILEAMKMEQPLAAHKGGTVTGLTVEVGQTITAGTEICQIKD